MLPERMDLARRAQPSELPEWMDEPCTYADFRACLIDLAKANTLTLARRPTLQWLNRIVASSESSKPLHIVDVGCGGGDMLRSVSRWAKHRGIAVMLTGLDLNPYAIQAAREFTASGTAIEWVCGDAYSYDPPSGVDIILSSLFTHHLPDREIVRYLAWMESTARRGWFVNDLYRMRIYIHMFRALSTAARWHSFVQHDGPVSICRSFRHADWRILCEAANLSQASLQIQKRIPGRLCVGRMK